jgi:hypothetical protein
MEQTEFFAMRIDPKLRDVINQMAEMDDRKSSSFVKHLIKREAERRGLLLPATPAPNEGAQQGAGG